MNFMVERKLKTQCGLFLLDFEFNHLTSIKKNDQKISKFLSLEFINY